MSTSPPEVSVILPTYNRARFLPAAFAAIAAQDMPSLEVVVVDDGSTDDSEAVLDSLTASFPHPVRRLHQQNLGAYGARNTGVAAAEGAYLAFYDSDDVWLAHHLKSCVGALRDNPDVDWVYSASEIVDLESGVTLDRQCFYQNGQPRPFMRLAHESRGPLKVITDAGAILCQIQHGLYCGMQNSVFRRRVFDRLRFEWETRNEAEDQVFAIRALSAGFRLAYFDDVHVRYHVHADNSSGAAKGISLAKLDRVYRPLIRGYERLEQEIPLTPVERRALRQRINQELFWHLGYAGYWTAGARAEAIGIFREALHVWPWDLREWKTYVLGVLRASVRGSGATKTRRHEDT